MFRYPRTAHVFDSMGTPDDRHLSVEESYKIISDSGLCVEEKVDGSNIGIFFEGEEDTLTLQCRGHELGSHPQYDLLKSWVQIKRSLLWGVLGTVFVLYGEWLYARHTVRYDKLPHYFLEYDIYDRGNGTFLDTDSRSMLLEGCGICSVPVLHRGPLTLEGLKGLLGPSLFSTTEKAEGLYLKVERDGKSLARAKYVRPDFIHRVATSQHWQKKPLEPNVLAKDADIWC